MKRWGAGLLGLLLGCGSAAVETRAAPEQADSVAADAAAEALPTLEPDASIDAGPPDASQTCDGVNGRWYPSDYAKTGCYKPTRPVDGAGYACPIVGGPTAYVIEFICDAGPPVPPEVGDLHCGGPTQKAGGGFVVCCEATVSATLGCAWTQ